jgi:RTX calcium-binding nonapeptide repeat (4 copies)
MRIHRAALVVAVLASLTLTLAGPAQAKRMLGTKGSDRIVGTAKADVIKARGGNDRARAVVAGTGSGEGAAPTA